MASSLSSSSSSTSSSSTHISAPLDAATQIQDIRIFERNIGKSVSSLSTLRRRYIVVISLLILSSIYWTWRLQAKLTSNQPQNRAPQETLRLWFAWAIVGIIPTILVLFAMYQSTVVMPSRFIERLNRSLSDYHVAYSAETGRLLRTVNRNTDHDHLNLRHPVRLRSSYRSR